MPPKQRPRRREPDPVDFDMTVWTEALSDNHLLCRDIGHTWRPARAWLDDNAYGRIMRCLRCKTERHQYLSMSGHVMANRYDYPEGYLAPKGHGLMVGTDRDNLRLESVLRLISKE